MATASQTSNADQMIEKYNSSARYVAQATQQTYNPQEALNEALSAAVSQLESLEPTQRPTSIRGIMNNAYLESHPKEVARVRAETLHDIATMIDSGADLQTRRPYMEVATHKVHNPTIANDLKPYMAEINALRSNSPAPQAAPAREAASNLVPSAEQEARVDRSVHHRQEILERAGYETRSLSANGQVKASDGVVDNQWGKTSRAAQSTMLADLNEGKLNGLDPALLADLRKTFGPEMQAMNRNNTQPNEVGAPSQVGGGRQTTVASSR